jgi:hypothetical protein
VNLAQNRRALAQLLSSGVYACFNLLLFDPDSTMASLRESLALMRDGAHVPMNFCRTEIYVGTPLMRRLQREGRLIGDEFGWDYHISDPRAEIAFRVFARAFYDRNFRANGLMNSNLGLGYHLHLLRHFYPHAVTPALVARAEATITRVNLDSVAWLERVFAYADSSADADDRRVQDHAEHLAEEVADATQALEREVDAATRAIIAAAGAPQRRSSSKWRNLAVGALALPLAACGPKRLAVMPLDPPPPPHDQSSEPRDGSSSEPVTMPPDPAPPPPDSAMIPTDPPPPPHNGRRPEMISADLASGPSAPHGKKKRRPNPPLPPPEHK